MRPMLPLAVVVRQGSTSMAASEYLHSGLCEKRLGIELCSADALTSIPEDKCDPLQFARNNQSCDWAVEHMQPPFMKVSYLAVVF